MTARNCWRRWSGQACSWSSSTTYGAGGATTICSPICCGPGWSRIPERARRLHRNAAAVVRAARAARRAIRHALAAGEQEWAARLVEEHFDTVFNLRGEQATIQSWLPALPEDLVRSRPRLLLAQAQMASMRGDLQAMEPLLEAAERVIGRADEEPFEPARAPGQPPGERPGHAGPAAKLRGPAARGRRGDRRPDPGGHGASRRERADALLGRPGVPGHARMAARTAGRRRGEPSSPASGGGAGRARSRPRRGGITAWPGCSAARAVSTPPPRTCERALAAAGEPGQPLRPAAGPALVGLARSPTSATISTGHWST